MRRAAILLAGMLWAAVSPAGANVPVDVELVIAVDVSRSMTAHELEIQRRGYVEALTSPEVIDAIRRGPYGQVALTYVEWAGRDSQNIVVGWTLVRDRAGAEAFARQLSVSFINSMRRTSISGAIDHAASLFDGNGFEGERQVIDISGDGPNNQGRQGTAARDEAVARGIEINGLPLMTREGAGMQWHLEDLDVYYRECVIGGPTAFVLPVLDWTDFPLAVRRKLVMELVDRRGAPPGDAPAVVPVDAPDYDCLIGEKIWRDIQGDWN